LPFWWEGSFHQFSDLPFLFGTICLCSWKFLIWNLLWGNEMTNKKNIVCVWGLVCYEVARSWWMAPIKFFKPTNRCWICCEAGSIQCPKVDRLVKSMKSHQNPPILGMISYYICRGPYIFWTIKTFGPNC
jgi:hypothetical protein